MPRLAHKLEHPVGHMLRRYLEPSAYVILYDRPEKNVLFIIVHNIIISYAGAHKHLLYALYTFKLVKQLNIVRVIGAHILARLVAEALLIRTDAAFKLFFASGESEIRRRAANVVYITLE